MQINWTTTLISSLLSGLIAVIVSILYYRRYEKRQTKLATLRRFAANRYDLKDDEFSKAINEIFIVFSGCAKVRQALKRLPEDRVSNSQVAPVTDQLMIELFKAMCDDLGLKYTEFTDSFFLIPFNTRQSSIRS